MRLEFVLTFVQWGWSIFLTMSTKGFVLVSSNPDKRKRLPLESYVQIAATHSSRNTNSVTVDVDINGDFTMIRSSHGAQQIKEDGSRRMAMEEWMKHKVKFGKYKGSSLYMVYTNDPHYIKWVSENVVYLDEPWQKALQRLQDDERERGVA